MKQSAPQAPLFGFDGPFLRKLDHLALVNRREMVGPSAGPRRSLHHGASPEFSDFRDYSPGDDFRRIDWNAYARLDRLFLRLYRAEEMTTLTIFLDHSPSMHFGSPSKVQTAARVAAALSYIALAAYDRVAVVGYAERIDHSLAAQSGKAAIPRVWRAIADIAESTGSATDFAALCRFSRMRHSTGVAVLISDFLTDSDWRTGLRSLRSTGQEVNVIQILAPEELNPSLRGDWALQDVETGREVEVTMTTRLLRRYGEELAAYTEVLLDFCHQHDMAFAQIASDAPVEDLILRQLRFAGMIQ
jgi:uncharacterized protein (DUF58 family)